MDVGPVQISIKSQIRFKISMGKKSANKYNHTILYTKHQSELSINLAHSAQNLKLGSVSFPTSRFQRSDFRIMSFPERFYVYFYTANIQNS